jgi:murein L,D-transpeptidase YcbB/YkuD
MFKRLLGRESIVQDSSIYSNQDYSDLILDSTSIEHYIAKDTALEVFAEDILSFYSRRHFQSAWFTNNEMSNSADAFFSTLNDYQINFEDSSLVRPQLINLWNQAKTDSVFFAKHPAERLKFEIGLTSTFFQYAQKAYYGTDKNPKDLEWFIPRKKKDYQHLLDTLVQSPESYHINEPVNDYYRNLKAALIAYRTIEKRGGFPTVNYQKGLRKGDSSENVLLLKSYLATTKDLAENDSSILFSDSLYTAIKSFQARMGLRTSGVPDSITVREMNVPVRQRIRQMMVNMERLRWIPDQEPDNYFLVNIPEYRLHIFEHKQYQWSMNVVVGRTATATSIFSGNLSVVGFCPYWNVPQSIIKNEMLPKLKANPGYIAKNNLEVLKNGKPINPYSVSWSKYKTGVPYVIRQKPGPSNALGLVAFYFPNSYDIYLHDTPAKSFFGETNRAFSHGCIRLSEPEKLAQYIFRNDSVLTADSIHVLMNKYEEKKVRVKPSIPVFIGYFTAWVDHTGKLNFRPDIYGLDIKLEKEVFGTEKLIQ